MNIHIVYCKDGDNGQIVDQVFLNEDAAIDYVITEIFGKNSYYTGMPERIKRDSAKDHVNEYVIYDG